MRIELVGGPYDGDYINTDLKPQVVFPGGVLTPTKVEDGEIPSWPPEIYYHTYDLVWWQSKYGELERIYRYNPEASQ